MLTEGAVRTSDKRAQFVGVEAYVEAGGEVLNDLFQADDGGWLQDVSLLDMLVAEKLREAADEVAAEGFKWTETFIDLPYAHLYGLRRLNGDQPELTSEQEATRDALLAEQERIEAALEELDGRPEVFEPAEVAIAGAFLSIGSDGRLRIDRGYVRREDEPPVREAEPASEMEAARAQAVDTIAAGSKA